MLSGHPDIGQLLQDLTTGVRESLGDKLIGLYIYGSLVSGDFNYHTSDIDFIGVSETELTELQIAGLNAMHGGLLSAHGRWAPRLEGSYFTRAGIRRFDPNHLDQARWSFGAFELRMEEHGQEWDIHRRMLLDHGVALNGPEPSALVDPVSASQLKAAVRDVLANWWKPMFADSLRLEDLQYRCYAVHTMCRALYTLRYGGVATKPEAARWAINNLDEKWRPLIRGSFAWPQSRQEVGLEETLALIRFVVNAALPGK